jgi:aspartate kinase
VLSTKIVSAYLNKEGINNKWVDIRRVIKTDNNYRDANVNFQESKKNSLIDFKFEDNQVFITQGFIASDPDGHTTTLGREGSDYTAALLASFLSAESVTLWKDVAGIFNADPALFSDATLLKELSYQEMIELAFYGARVIHPKTIKPLKGAGIKLHVRSFYEPEQIGTIVSKDALPMIDLPVFVIKEMQVLISISLWDLSFISEYHLSLLFSLLNKFRLKANVIQHSAVSFSVCVDTPMGKEIEELIAFLKVDFKVLYNKNLQLITIRNYTERDIQKMINGRKIYIEQRSRNTVQFVTD